MILEWRDEKESKIPKRIPGMALHIKGTISRHYSNIRIVQVIPVYRVKQCLRDHL